MSATQEKAINLTVKQRDFIRYYLGRANGNATVAARLAGYGSPKERGCELTHNPTVAAEIKRVLDERAMPANDVLARLADQARGPSIYLRAAGERVYIDAEGMLEDGMGHLIKGVKETVTKDGDRIQTIEFADSQAALVHLGRHHKLFTDKAEVTGADGEAFTVKVISGVSLDDL
jgi:hypothetical protein